MDTTDPRSPVEEVTGPVYSGPVHDALIDAVRHSSGEEILAAIDTSPNRAPRSEELAFLTPDRARAAREERERTIEFQLPRTGGKALVRRVALADVAMIARLPDFLQRRVLQMVDSLQSVGEPKAVRDDGSIDYDKALKLMKGDADAVDAICVMGFVRPPLIFDERERTSDDQVVASDLDPADRRAFYDFCGGRQEAEAKRLEPFPAGSPEDVVAGGSGGVDAFPTLDLIGSAGSGL